MDIAFRAVDLLYTEPDLVFQTGPDVTTWSSQEMDASLFSMIDNFRQKATVPTVPYNNYHGYPSK
jgi:hypothetical protein